MAELERLEHWLAPLLAQLQPQQVNRLAREVARELRALNSAAIRAQHGPDGQAWEPRKKQIRDARGKIKAKRQQALFTKLRNASPLKAGAQGASAVVQFVGRTERIARVHHFGLRDRVKPGGPDYDYPQRPLLGIPPEFEERLKDRVIAHLAGGR